MENNALGWGTKLKNLNWKERLVILVVTEKQKLNEV
jgi:hypothetical protein